MPWGVYEGTSCGSTNTLVSGSYIGFLKNDFSIQFSASFPYFVCYEGVSLLLLRGPSPLLGFMGAVQKVDLMALVE